MKRLFLVPLISATFSAGWSTTALPRPESALPGAPLVAAAGTPDPTTADAEDDPFLWLEDVEGAVALAWVARRNEATLSGLARNPVWQDTYDRILAILNAPDRIDSPSIMGDRIFNFWQDDVHRRGIWRRTTWDGYLSGTERGAAPDTGLRAAQVNADALCRPIAFWVYRDFHMASR
jgi:prolyl oligopeptidase